MSKANFQRIRIEGMEAVTKELNRIRAAQAPAINRAIDDTVKFGQKAAVDAIFNRYGFKSRSYIEQHLSVSVDPRNLKGVITARYRASTLTRFARPLTRTGKNGRSRTDGHMISALRNQPTWFKGTFTVIGKNGNQIMFERQKGDNSWRKLKGQKAMYGPSVAGSFRKIRNDIEPPIIAYLRNKYGQYSDT
ncbi:hypothetical protein [Shewanella mangrovisoli]|uniref:hypothetical protein n=1 Tax=Shewanella mangrovisoli TaxID=2864211 RepID=UPI0035BAA9FE